jgi:hypothetical protein
MGRRRAFSFLGARCRFTLIHANECKKNCECVRTNVFLLLICSLYLFCDRQHELGAFWLLLWSVPVTGTRQGRFLQPPGTGDLHRPSPVALAWGPQP